MNHICLNGGKMPASGVSNYLAARHHYKRTRGSRLLALPSLGPQSRCSCSKNIIWPLLSHMCTAVTFSFSFFCWQLGNICSLLILHIFGFRTKIQRLQMWQTWMCTMSERKTKQRKHNYHLLSWQLSALIMSPGWSFWNITKALSCSYAGTCCVQNWVWCQCNHTSSVKFKD